MAKKRKKSKKAKQASVPAPSVQSQRPLEQLTEMERMEARFGAPKRQPPTPPAEPTPQPQQDTPIAVADKPRKKRWRLPWHKKKSRLVQTQKTDEVDLPLVRPKRRKKSRWARLFDTSMRKYPPHKRRAIKRHRRARWDKFCKFCLTLFTAWCLIVSVAQFFTVQNIRFEGVTRYPVADVAEIFAVDEGSSLFFTNTSKGVDALQKKYPYFSEVKVTRELPQTLVVTVIETTPAAAVPYGDNDWYLVDEQTRVLEKTQHIEGIDLPIVTGMRAPLVVVMGKPLPMDEEGKTPILQNLLDTLKQADMLSRVRRINLNTLYDICFEVDYRIAVRVGDGSDLAHKLRWIPVLLEEGRVGATDIARFDLTDTAQVSVMLLTQEELDSLLEEPAKDAESLLVSPAVLTGEEPPPERTSETTEDEAEPAVEEEGEEGA